MRLANILKPLPFGNKPLPGFQPHRSVHGFAATWLLLLDKLDK